MAIKILVVDDMAIYRKILTTVIERFDGFEVAGTASNGVFALKKMELNEIHLVLLDINMPEMSGTEVVKKVRELSSCADTKIIMVSTESSQELIDGLMANGANGYITKPFTPEKFQEKLSPLMN